MQIRRYLYTNLDLSYRLAIQLRDFRRYTVYIDLVNRENQIHSVETLEVQRSLHNPMVFPREDHYFSRDLLHQHFQAGHYDFNGRLIHLKMGTPKLYILFLETYHI